jgi:hypothetical protein
MITVSQGNNKVATTLTPSPELLQARQPETKLFCDYIIVMLQVLLKGGQVSHQTPLY